MLCSLKGKKKKKKNLSFNKLFCFVSIGLWQEAIRSQTSRCITAIVVERKEEKEEEWRREIRLLNLFLLNDEGCIADVPLGEMITRV